ncbi:MAG: hypothetical protein IJB53_03425 [Mailhella sp.]|nr:hypothetical protein [Mailhella sp.]
MSYLVRNAEGKVLGVLPNSLRIIAEVRSSEGERASAISVGAEWPVPAYTVGASQLEIFMDGLACMKGGQYEEAGEEGEQSTTIIWNIDIDTDRDILIRQTVLRTNTLEAVGELRSFGGERAEAISAGRDWSVPPYEVDSGRLEVYVDGIACMKGQQYREKGTSGTQSAEIIWNMDVGTDCDILIRSK